MAPWGMAADENPQPTTGETRLVCEVLRVAYEDLRSSDRYRRWDAQRFWLNARQVAELACMVNLDAAALLARVQPFLQ